MMSMMNIAGIIIAIIAINYITTLVMTFMGIELEFYGSYLLWIVAILLFWGVLPGPVNYFE
tara:strand:+ start:154 stop:336 length:183 start_codon:yes stop_codon:yes gene_type:complete